MTADQAIARSRSHNEIVTLDEYTEEAFQTLSSECDDQVFANGMWEFWANDPESDERMTWRVHVPEAADAIVAADKALSKAGYDTLKASTDERLLLAVTSPDDDDADSVLAEIQAIVEPHGCVATWTGSGNTDADGSSTDDIAIEVVP